MESNIKKILEILKIESMSPGQYTMIEDILDEIYECGVENQPSKPELDDEYDRGYQEGYSDAKAKYES